MRIRYLLLTLLAAAVIGCGGESTADEATQDRTAERGAETASTGTSTDTSTQAEPPSGDEATTEEAATEARSETVDEFELKWSIEDANLSFSVSAPTDGWVAVGFEPDRMMMGANIIIGYVADGEAVVSDQTGVTTVTHGPDTENGGTDDLIDRGGTESDGSTEIRFTIPLDSGDSTDKPLSPGTEHTIILAYGDRDDLESYHVLRTTARITL